MKRWTTPLLTAALVVAVAGFVAGVLASARGGDPAPRPPVVVGTDVDPTAPSGTTSTRSSRPPRSGTGSAEPTGSPATDRPTVVNPGYSEDDDDQGDDDDDDADDRDDRDDQDHGGHGGHGRDDDHRGHGHGGGDDDEHDDHEGRGDDD